MASAEDTSRMMAPAEDTNKIGLIPATFMVAGNMMGSGVFLLPANLAAAGGIALLGWIITMIGSVALALVFAKLASIDPVAGGPYAYTRKAFGNYMGYQTNLIYWLANVVGNVGLAVAGLGYLSGFFPGLSNQWVLAFAQIAVIWLFIYINILGPKLVGRVQTVTTMCALVPIVLTAILGWFWFSGHTYMEGWNVSGKSSFGAISSTLAITLWAFIGVESASVSAGVVKNPARNVPIATVAGVLLAGVCYILSSSVIMGMIPNKALQASSAPFADAARIAFGATAGNIVAICAAVGCLGSLLGWTLLVGQTAKAAADDGLFPNIFAKINSKMVPSAGLALVGLIMTVQVLLTVSPSASEQFGKIISIAVIMTLLPYIYSAISLKVLGYKRMPDRQYVIYTIIGLIAALYSLSALIGSDGEQARWSLIFVIATVIFYSASVSRQRAIDEHQATVGGRAPHWVRHVAVAAAIVSLALVFWFSEAQHRDLHLFRRVPLPVAPATQSIDAPPQGGAAQTPAAPQ